MARREQGRFLGIPYNWKPLKREQAGKGPWDPDDRRIFTPKNYGFGYTMNVAAIWRRLTRR